MKLKPLLAGLAIALIIVVIAGLYLFNKPHQGIGGRQVDVYITATDLYTAFQTDEQAANKKYLNKVIEVSGNVSEIRNENGADIILLNAKNPMGGIVCQLSNDHTQKKLLKEKTTSLTIRGKCTGFLMDVNLVDCIIK